MKIFCRKKFRKTTRRTGRRALSLWVDIDGGYSLRSSRRFPLAPAIALVEIETYRKGPVHDGGRVIKAPEEPDNQRRDFSLKNQ